MQQQLVFYCTVLGALSLTRDSFQTTPPYANTFSKGVWKAKEIELSGTEAYSGLILPLVKALHHFRTVVKPAERIQYFDAHLVIALGIIDAPMIGVSIENGKTNLSLIPWVRVLRHEYSEEREKWDRDQFWTVDVVHKDFLSEYLKGQVLPFAEKFSARVLRHQVELVRGRGFVAGFRTDSSSSIEERLAAGPP
jgi:hypothetical protein